jgi:hypothetical protein
MKHPLPSLRSLSSDYSGYERMHQLLRLATTALVITCNKHPHMLLETFIILFLIDEILKHRRIKPQENKKNVNSRRTRGQGSK